MMKNKIRWGISSTGNIAHKFAKGLAVLKDAELIAVASRTLENADKFGDEFGIKHRYVGVEALAANEEVDAIYISSPHSGHKRDTMACLNAGKAVLCEKPFSINSSEAREMVNLAEEKNVFLMEAMWTYFFPAMVKVRQLIKSGAIGEVRQVHGSFCFRAGINPKGRLFSPALGGGGLLDVGIYPIALSRMVYGKEPSEIKAIAAIGKTGVDEQTAMLFGYHNGAMGLLSCAIRTETEHTAEIYGTEGYIKIPPVFWQPDRFILNINGEEKEFYFERTGNGYNYEAAEVMECLRNGLTESPIVPHTLTLGMMETLDKVRQQIGLEYPIE